MNRTVESILTYVVAPIVVLVVGIFVGKWIESASSNTTFIDYKITQTANILNQIAGKTDLKINNQSVESVGVIDFEVYNLTNRVYDSITVELILRSAQNHIGRLLNIEYRDQHNLRERVKLVRVDSTDDHMIKLSMSIRPVNETQKPLLKGSVIVQNIDDITSMIEIKKAGIEPRIMIVKTEQKRSRDLNFAIAVISLLAGMLVLVLQRGYRSLTRFSAKYDALKDDLTAAHDESVKMQMEFYKIRTELEVRIRQFEEDERKGQN